MNGGRAAAREVALDAVLTAAVTGKLGPWLEGPATTSDDAWDGSLRVFALVLSLRWADAQALAASMPAPSTQDPDGWWLRRATALWAAAGDPGPSSDAGIGALTDPAAPAPTGPYSRFVGHLAVEAVLAHARLDLVGPVAEPFGAHLWDPLVLAGRPHPWGAVRAVCRVRLLAFHGDITAASSALGAIPEPQEGPLRALLAGTACLVGGGLAERSEVRRLVAVVDQHAPAPVDLLTAGAQVLASLGVIILGDVAEAARRVLLAGGDAGLTRLDVIDRALSLEMLVNLAGSAGDLDAAEAWADQAAPLLSSPIADSTVARLNSRLALFAGRTADAVVWGERAVARAREAERVMEYAEGEIVLNRARLNHRGSGGTASRELGALVVWAERRGHLAVRPSASRELRAAGRRLPPVSGSGWVGLTAREAAVARLAAGGQSNREIATRLHVTEHTARAHVSRVLAAFAVGTRSALPASMSVPAAPGDGRGRAALTCRQAEVAGLVARGLGNEGIALELGLSRRTVERHVSDILLRWSLPNRTALAATAKVPPAD